MSPPPPSFRVESQERSSTPGPSSGESLPWAPSRSGEETTDHPRGLRSFLSRGTEGETCTTEMILVSTVLASVVLRRVYLTRPHQHACGCQERVRYEYYLQTDSHITMTHTTEVWLKNIKTKCIWEAILLIHYWYTWSSLQLEDLFYEIKEKWFITLWGI